MRVRRLHLALAFVALVVSTVGIWLWWNFRTEAVPEQLAPVEGDPTTLVLPGIGEQEDLDLASLRGTTTFFSLVGAFSASPTKEGERLNRAINRWELPSSTRGFIVVDLPGFGWLRAQARPFVEAFAAETRYPIYFDFDGAFRKKFNLVKGHPGFVVLDADGEVVHRHSGDASPEQVTMLGELLGAREPASGPPAPAFTAGPLDDERCASSGCVLVFVGRPVARAELPAQRAGFDPDLAERWRKLQDPAVRLLQLAMRAKLSATPPARAVIVGDVPDVPLEGWTRVASADEARAAFGLAPEASAIVVIDRQGRVALREEGFVPLFRWGRIADLLGIEMDFDFGGP